MKTKTKEQLAEEHAGFIKQLLFRELDSKMELYKAAFIHGFKHGKEDKNDNRRNRA